ncbi:hypothetical protein T265_02059 [Opisthorchis viverrini]|uniref:G-protein coupled receptors family 1 profile domain-containing protein n=1 Tax=Opisthorchis viverrini TaxID=6198 RepID=A0A074ZWJ7_OPIVI|nr:hypothetical protein T265_02059 [Opisthorchis viverrini]KER31833.1 hypothetical protein T265_02059 [Opisthorchis viverrini]
MPSVSCGFPVKNIQSSVNYFRAYVTPILTIVGVFGNAVALYLFATHQPRNRFAIYAMALAISDSLVLLSNSFLDDFVGSGLPFLSNGRLGVKLDALSVEACRLMELTGFWFIFTSGSLLVAFSLDRVACLFRPMQCRTNEGIKLALLVCGIIMALGLLLGLPQVMLFELSDRPTANTTQAYLFSKSCKLSIGNQLCSFGFNVPYPKASQLRTDKPYLDALFSPSMWTAQDLEQISDKITFILDSVTSSKEFYTHESVFSFDKRDSTQSAFEANSEPESR